MPPRRLPASNKLVNKALIVLHNVKGVTLKRIYSHISEKYDIAISRQRAVVIKKYITSLRLAEDITNTTGKGLNGHFKLINKQRFLRKLNSEETHSSLVRGRTVNNRAVVSTGENSASRDAQQPGNNGRTKKNRSPTVLGLPLPQVDSLPGSLGQLSKPSDSTNQRTSAAYFQEETPIISPAYASPPIPDESILYAPQKRRAHDIQPFQNTKTIDESGTPRSRLTKRRNRLNSEL